MTDAANDLEPTYEVRERPELGRFELYRSARAGVEPEVVGFADYHTRGSSIVVPHVETLRQYRGHGLGARLMEGLLDQVRASERTIVPLCSFAAGYIDEHPEQHDLVADR